MEIEDIRIRIEMDIYDPTSALVGCYSLLIRINTRNFSNLQKKKTNPNQIDKYTPIIENYSFFFNSKKKKSYAVMLFTSY